MNIQLWLKQFKEDDVIAQIFVDIPFKLEFGLNVMLNDVSKKSKGTKATGGLWAILKQNIHHL